eukprot:TRINITY_DN9790_c0_g1_i1.p1 TRINITY_DN9790_c0_g1~~TRINITY_DN9790_c0_g1_i1.p1  ORF type:complete len:256 (-),score=49.67 TRINITY_DN9790_c0_g1_i1:266-1033(-)
MDHNTSLPNHMKELATTGLPSTPGSPVRHSPSMPQWPGSPAHHSPSVPGSPARHTSDLPSLPDAIPHELLLYVLSFLDAPCLLNVRLVSHLMLALAEDDMLWKRLFAVDYCWLASGASSSWIKEYQRHWQMLCRTNRWTGMSKWIEPKGHEQEQPTRMVMVFRKGMRTFSGSGVTWNGTHRHEFVVSGERTGLLRYTWLKQFGTHTSRYEGEIHLDEQIMTGTLAYNDGHNQWLGVFRYTLAFEEPIAQNASASR